MTKARPTAVNKCTPKYLPRNRSHRIILTVAPKGEALTTIARFSVELALRGRCSNYTRVRPWWRNEPEGIELGRRNRSLAATRRLGVLA